MVLYLLVQKIFKSFCISTFNDDNGAQHNARFCFKLKKTYLDIFSELGKTISIAKIQQREKIRKMGLKMADTTKDFGSKRISIELLWAK